MKLYLNFFKFVALDYGVVFSKYFFPVYYVVKATFMGFGESVFLAKGEAALTIVAQETGFLCTIPTFALVLLIRIPADVILFLG